MVSYPNYDLNNYSEVSDARLKAAIEDGSASLADQQLRQWRNKALNDTYEPRLHLQDPDAVGSAGGGRGGYELHL